MPLGATPVTGRGAVGARVEKGAGMEVGAAEGRDEGGDTGDRPGMLMGKHFASRRWLTSYFHCGSLLAS